MSPQRATSAPPAFHGQPSLPLVAEALAEALFYAALSVVGICLVALAV